MALLAIRKNRSCFIGEVLAIVHFLFVPRGLPRFLQVYGPVTRVEREREKGGKRVRDH